MSPMSPRLLRPRQTGFDPRSISGLSLWLDATQGVTTVSNQVSVWADQSGNGRDFSQPTGNPRPNYTSTLNGKPVISFVAVASTLLQRSAVTNADIGGSGGVSFWIVFRVTSAAAYVTCQFPGATDGFDRFSSGGSFPAQFRSVRASAVSIGMPDTGTVLYGQIVNVAANTHTWRRQSAQRASATPDYTNWRAGTNATWLIGRGDTGFFNGDIAEVIIYGNPLDATQIARVESYLATKWGAT